MRVEPVAQAEAQELLRKSEKAGRRSLFEQDSASSTAETDVRTQQGLENIAPLRREVFDGANRLVQYGVYFTVSASDEVLLRDRCRQLQSACINVGLQIGTCRPQAWEAYTSSIPLGIDTVRLHHLVDAKTVAMGMPIVSQGMRPGAHGRPIIYGENYHTGAPEFLDRWALNGPMQVLIANIGSGKTYAQNWYMLQNQLLGNVRQFVLDPKNHEYRDIIRFLGGTYIALNGRAQYHINPLALPPLTTAQLALLDPEESDVIGNRISFVRSLLIRQLTRTGTVVPGQRITLLDEALQAAYAGAGIDGSLPSTWGAQPPLLDDVYTYVLAHDAELAAALRMFTSGVLGSLINQQTNIPDDFEAAGH